MAETKELGAQSAADLRNSIIAELEDGVTRGILTRRDIGALTLADGRKVPARAYYSTSGEGFRPDNVFAQNTAVLDTEIGTVSLSARIGDDVVYAFLGSDNKLIYNGGSEGSSTGAKVEGATRRLLGQVTGRASQVA